MAEQPTPETKLKYWAFISYSHKDAAWGKWLHLAIETYRIPRTVRRLTLDQALPRRLFPVFPDREELPTSGRIIDFSRFLLGEDKQRTEKRVD